MSITPRDEYSHGLVVTRKTNEGIIIEANGKKLQILITKNGLSYIKLLFSTENREDFVIFRKEDYEQEKAKRASGEAFYKPKRD
jgi:sRNA-binding carbon storage regulator CsrA